MRTFDYFLFENFDAEEQAQNPANPRRFLGKQTDALLSSVFEHTNVETGRFNDVQLLLTEGILRSDNGLLFSGCPIFLREDAEALSRDIPVRAKAIARHLTGVLSKIQACCHSLKNGFSDELNLYHIICGMIFDGALFDMMSAHGVLSTSCLHQSGLDYLSVIYEKCEELASISNRLLCSYNRFADRKCSLQSFGDSDGDRFDFYRFFRLMEQKHLPAAYEPALALVKANKLDKSIILAETAHWVTKGSCAQSVMQLLDLFGYASDGKLVVPVYTATHKDVIDQIQQIVEERIGQVMAEALHEISSSLDITAVRHGVNPLEIANELYHILFGFINEELIRSEIVAAPPFRPGEGRYLSSIEIC